MAVKVKLPTNLAFARGLNPSDGIFMQARSCDDQPRFAPVTVERRQKLGAVSHFSQKTKADRDRLDLNPAAGGTDVAMLRPDHDILSVRFSLAIHCDPAAPHACVDTQYAALLRRFAAAYGTNIGLGPLAERYVRSIFSGRWIWRNRMVADGGSVTVAALYREMEPVTLEMSDIPDRFEVALEPELAGRLRMAPGSEVYPSQ